LGALGERWIPKESRILGAPALLPSEAFSSWCWRIATRCRIPIKAVLASFGVSSPSFWVDSGRVPINLQKMARVVSSPAGEIASLTWPATSVLAIPDFACLMTEPLDRRPIYRYCEICLRSDPIPYIRRLWRLTCAYVCPIHENVLRDRCPCCQVRINLSEDAARSSESIRRCSHCGMDLCDTTPVFLPDELLFGVLIRQIKLIHQISRSTAPPDWPYWLPSVLEDMITSKRNVMELRFVPSIQATYGRIIESFQKSELDIRPPEEHIRILSKYLDYVRSPSVSASPKTFATGIDSRMFGRDASKLIVTYLKQCQTLARETYFWHVDRGNPLEVPNYVAEETLKATIHWIKNLCRSAH